jgi:diguanylate cyclase (GGDEF)-like protein
MQDEPDRLVSPSVASRRLMAWSAAAMFGGAVATGLGELLIPGGPTFSVIPGLCALGGSVWLVFAGPRLPLPVLAALGPIGVVLIGFAVATSNAPSDGSILYAWPVVWTAYFFGRRGAVLIVAWIGVVEALVLVNMPAGFANPDRWIDVMVGMTVIAIVIQALSRRNAQLLQRLAAEARTDHLTDLANRRGFEERVEVELARARREATSVAVVSFDLDHFKSVNDQLGHDAGDQVLATLAAVLRAETRGTDVAARMGGEEFAVVLAPSEVDDALEYAERVRAAFAVAGMGVQAWPTISAGVAAALAPAEIEQLLRAADGALYEAKAKGRDRVVAEPPRLVAAV